LDSSLGDFLRQVPLGLLAAPLFFGAIYVGLMIYIFRRAAQRRRRARGDLPARSIPQPAMQPAAPRVTTSGLRNLPEPDIDLLVEPALMSLDALLKAEPARAPVVSMPEISSSSNALAVVSAVPSAVTVEKTVETTEKVDWLSMMPPGSPAPTPNNAIPSDAEHNDMVEVMRIWRDLGDGSLVIELGGRRYRSINEISNSELVRRFTAVVRELWLMVNNGAPNRSTTLPNAPSGNAGLNAGTSGSVSSSTGGTGSLRNRIGILNPPPEPEQEVSKPRGLLRGASRQTSTQPEASRRPGIGDAVEDYLQFKLSSTPQFQARSIHVRPAVDGGIRIEVDGHYYDGVGDVVDADVRDFLLATLREWEARQ
jgi:hypothetical protein